jgi:predicted N-formylglutamate amidohydrolase
VQPVETIDAESQAALLILCDHAGNALPPTYGTLGLPRSELGRHIAYDPGAAAVTRSLAKALGAKAVLSRYSRLLIDCNRGEDDPTLIMRISDGSVIPGNAAVNEEERQRRIGAFHAPYHAAIGAAIDSRLASGTVPILLSIHSFTPAWRGTARPWHAGILWDADPRLAVPLVDHLRAMPRLIVGDNEPYDGALANDTLYRHGTRRGLAHALIEIRQDLIADDRGVDAWSSRLAAVVAGLMADSELHQIRHYGSRTGPVREV